jgi:hypothetical protein
VSVECECESVGFGCHDMPFLFFYFVLGQNNNLLQVRNAASWAGGLMLFKQHPEFPSDTNLVSQVRPSQVKSSEQKHAHAYTATGVGFVALRPWSDLMGPAPLSPRPAPACAAVGVMTPVAHPCP